MAKKKVGRRRDPETIKVWTGFGYIEAPKENFEAAVLSGKLCTKMDVVVHTLNVFLIVSLPWAGFWPWLTVMFDFHCFNVLDLPVAALASWKVFDYLPDAIAVWFEEATLVLEETGCRRYNRPFQRLGAIVFILITKICWFRFMRWPTASQRQLCLHACEFICSLGWLIRAWRRTHHQYAEMLRMRRGEEGHVERTIRNVAKDLVYVIHDDLGATYMGSDGLSIEGKIILSHLLIKGTSYCIEFVSNTLQNALSSSPVETALARPEHTAVPLYRQWQVFEAARIAAETICTVTETIDTASADTFVVDAKCLTTINKMLARAVAKETQFKEIIATTLGRDGIDDIASGLARIDRRRLRSEKSHAISVSSNRSRSERALSNSAGLGGLRVKSNEEVKVSPAYQDSRLQTEDSEKEQAMVDSTEATHDVECLCCLENAATVVFVNCGHLVYCQNCRMKMLRQKHKWRNAQKLRNQSDVACPLCRQESRTEDVVKFTGVVYS